MIFTEGKIYDKLEANEIEVRIMSAQFPIPAPVTLITQKTDIYDARDLAFGNGCLCVITGEDNGTFALYSPTEDGLRPRGKLTTLGCTLRQVRVSGTTAVVSGRSFGVYFIDISDPDRPEVLYHYDAVEFATGVAVDGNMAYISCRQHGVEAIDMTNPRHPKHVSTLRAGEVQSVRVQDGILYAGAWNERQIQLFDVTDPGKPQKLSAISLGGKGDGMFVKDGICYAAMGQHTGEVRRPTVTDPGYGMGNGLAVVDVSDPKNPAMLSQWMMPYAYYYCNYDMWSAIACGKYAIMAHTFNGVLIFNVEKPKEPKLVCHLPIKTERPACEMMDLRPSTVAHYPPKIPFDTETESYAPVTGIAADDGVLYVAVGKDCLRIVRSEEYFRKCDTAGHITQQYSAFTPLQPEGTAITAVDGQVHETIVVDGKIYAACGNGSIQVFDPDTMELLRTIPTKGAVRSLRQVNGLLIAACSTEGVCIFDGDRLIGTYHQDGEMYSQAIPSANGRFVMVHVNGTTLSILDISDPTNPKEVVRDRQTPSLIYFRQMTTQGVDGRYYAIFWANKRTVRWYDLSGETPVLMPWTQYGLNFRMGITGLDGGRVLLPARKRGYIIAPVDAESDILTSPAIEVEGTSISGKPMVFDDVLVFADVMTGKVQIVDAAAGKLLREFTFSGHPDLGCRLKDNLFIPLHYDGIAKINLKELCQQ